MNPDNLSLSEIAEILGISVSGLSNWQKRYGDFPNPCEITGRLRKYRLADVKAFMARNDLNTKRDRGAVERHLILESLGILRNSPIEVNDLDCMIVIGLFAEMWLNRPELLTVISNTGTLPLEVWGFNVNGRLDTTTFGKLHQGQLPNQRVQGENTQDVYRRLADNWLSASHMKSHKSAGLLRTELFLMQGRSGGKSPSNSTSRSLAQLINKIGRGLSILDLSAGVGVILDSYRSSARELCGQDINLQLIQFQQIIDALDGKPHKGLFARDSIAHFEEPWVNHFDVVICDGPLGVKKLSPDINPMDSRWKMYEQSSMQSDIDFWIQSVLAYLRYSDNENQTFRGVVVVTDSWLFSTQEKVMRTALLRNGNIEAVIRLGGGLYSGSQIPINLLILRKHHLPRTKIRLIDASSLGVVKRGNRELTQSDIAAIVRNLNGSGDPEFDAIDGTLFCRDVELEELLKNDSILLPRRYFKKFEVKPQSAPIAKEVELLLAKLNQKLLATDSQHVKDVLTNQLTKFTQKHGTPAPSRTFGEAVAFGKPFTVHFKTRPDDGLWGDEIDDADVVVCLAGSQIGVSITGATFKNMNPNWLRIAILRVDESVMSSTFLHEWLLTNSFHSQVDMYAGGTFLRAITKKELSRIAVPVPSHETQDALNQLVFEIQKLEGFVSEVMDEAQNLKLRLQDLKSAIFSTLDMDEEG